MYLREMKDKFLKEDMEKKEIKQKEIFEKDEILRLKRFRG